MVHSDEDVPSKFVVHLVNIECRVLGKAAGGKKKKIKRIILPSWAQVMNYSPIEDRGWQPSSENSEG